MLYAVSPARATPCVKIFWVLFGLLLVANSVAHAQETFNPTRVDQFDGRSWNNLTLDQSTNDDVKRLYKTGKKAFRREATLLDQPRDSGVNVQALLDGRNGNSRLVGFRLSYNSLGLNVDHLAQNMGVKPKTLYPSQRFSDWYLQVFPLVLLTTPDRASQMVEGFTDQLTRINNMQDQFNPDAVRIKFSNILVDIDQSGLKVLDSEGLKGDIRREIQTTPGSSNLEYASDSTGMYSVRAVLEKPKNKKGTILVTVLLSGQSSSGKVVSVGYIVNEVDRGLFGTSYVGSSDVMDAFRQARLQMGSIVTMKVKKDLPSSPKDYRQHTWDNLTNSAIR